MKDGQTRRIERAKSSERGFLAKNSVSMVFAAGPLAGSEIAIAKERTTFGRHAEMDVKLDDASISAKHAALELVPEGARMRDLGSTNGVLVNGARVALAGVKHGDEIRLGSLDFKLRIETRDSDPPAHRLSKR